MVTRIDICNLALQRIGAGPLQSESAPGAALVTGLYDAQLAVITNMKPWSFSLVTRQLAQTTPPASGFWTYAYQLPADRIGPPRAYFDTKGGEPFLEFELSEDLVLTNAATLYVRYQVSPKPIAWSPLFKECVIVAVAGAAAIPVREDQGLAGEFTRLVYGDPRTPGQLGLVHAAAVADAQSKSSRVLMGDGGPLVNARRS